MQIKVKLIFFNNNKPIFSKTQLDTEVKMTLEWDIYGVKNKLDINSQQLMQIKVKLSYI